MSSDRDSVFEADPIKNADLFQKGLATKKNDDKKTHYKKVEKGKKDMKAAKPVDSKAKSAKD